MRHLLGLLHPRREGRCGRYATEQRDELTPSHVLSSSRG
jgi:hypothetical protein